MPGHGAFYQLVAVASGGPRGCLQHSNVSMTIIRPPQQGHAGRKSSGSSESPGSGGAATFSSSRASTMLALARATGKQATMPDAMEAAWQDMEQEAADELVDRKRHNLLPVGAVATVVLVTEGDATLVEGDLAAVRDSDLVGVAGQIGEYRFRPGERRLRVDHPSLLPDGNKVAKESPPLGEMSKGA